MGVWPPSSWCSFHCKRNEWGCSTLAGNSNSPMTLLCHKWREEFQLNAAYTKITLQRFISTVKIFANQPSKFADQYYHYRSYWRQQCLFSSTSLSCIEMCMVCLFFKKLIASWYVLWLFHYFVTWSIQSVWSWFAFKSHSKYVHVSISRNRERLFSMIW